MTSIGEFLRDSVGFFYYVSSRSAYADHSTVPMTSAVPSYTYETAGVDRATADITRLPYGLAKAESEREAMRIFPDRYGIFRPGLIIGPDDPTDRFTYWPVRIHRGGEVLSPGDGTDPVQIIDVRDLGRLHGAVLGPRTHGHLQPRRTRHAAADVRTPVRHPRRDDRRDDVHLGAPRVPRRARRATLRRDAGVAAADAGSEGFARFDLSNEVAHGMTFRSLADTTQATLDFHFSRTPERQAEMRPGLPAEREAEILREWHASR